MWFFQVRKLAGKDGFAGKVTVARFDVLAHDVVAAPKIDDSQIEGGGKQVAIRLLEG